MAIDLWDSMGSEAKTHSWVGFLVIIAVHKLALPAMNKPCLDGYLHKFFWLNNMGW
jgi:hypothetical protein